MLDSLTLHDSLTLFNGTSHDSLTLSTLLSPSSSLPVTPLSVLCFPLLPSPHSSYRFAGSGLQPAYRSWQRGQRRCRAFRAPCLQWGRLVHLGGTSLAQEHC